LHTLSPATLQQIFKIGEAPFLQSGKDLRVIDQHGEFAFLLAGNNLHRDGRQLFLQFRSETRCAGLVPSGGAIDNLDRHLFLPFLV
jgi:hypothetical protein